MSEKEEEVQHVTIEVPGAEAAAEPTPEDEVPGS